LEKVVLMEITSRFRSYRRINNLAGAGVEFDGIRGHIIPDRGWPEQGMLGQPTRAALGTVAT
jgi:hypothetical protein